METKHKEKSPKIKRVFEELKAIKIENIRQSNKKMGLRINTTYNKKFNLDRLLFLIKNLKMNIKKIYIIKSFSKSFIYQSCKTLDQKFCSTVMM